MNQFAVNLSTVFTEVPFLERFRKAREFEFSYVECQFPYDFSIDEIKRELTRNQLSMVLLNLPPGKWKKGERGIAVDANRVEEFQNSVNIGIQYATSLKIPSIHCLAGTVSQHTIQSARETYIKNIRYAANQLAEHDLTLLIEPINCYDMPGYFLSDLLLAVELINEVQLPNVKLQFDFYHIERIHSNSLNLFKQSADRIGHVQIADPPRRHQPGTGELDFQAILQYLQENYQGYVGIEYTPLHRSEDSFAWLTNWRKGGQ